jgi:hypothetical protein
MPLYEDDRRDEPRRARGEGRRLRTAREAVSPRIGRWIWARSGRPMRRVQAAPMRGVGSDRHRIYRLAVSGGWVRYVWIDPEL